MSGLQVSVVVVSRDRPGHLCRCIMGLAQLDYPSFEIVVVADAPGLEAIAARVLDAELTTARFDDANISAARNAGIALASGQIVAFIDDDAVPEPSWLAHLTAPFADAGVIATSGFIRGWNGISWQWRGRLIGRDSADTEIADWGDSPRLIRPEADCVAKLQGTNMAVRREALAEIGGFDPAYRFYLDDADLALRLATLGATLLLPLAEVHHGFAASPRRRLDRAPISLHEIGASLAVFLNRHADPARHAEAIALARKAEQARLVGHETAGRINARDTARLMESFEAGLAEAQARPATPLAPLSAPTEPFQPFPAPETPMIRLAGRIWQARRLRAEAAARVARGERITLYLFSPTARPHRMRFTGGGWWEQRGGLFGRSERRGPLFRLTTFAARLARETARIAAVRPMKAPDDA